MEFAAVKAAEGILVERLVELFVGVPIQPSRDRRPVQPRRYVLYMGT